MEIIRFGELYSIPTSNGVSRPSAVRGEGFHMINMGELFSFDVINEMPMERVFLSDKEQKKYLVKKGDLLFARQSLVAAGAGKCSIVNNILEPTTFESHLIRVRLDETRCCPRYYYYLFKLPDNPIKTIVNQCAQAGIRGSELQKIKVPLPMLAEQHRIASILSAYDNLIENNNKRIRLLEQMAENLYKEWFVRFRFPGHEKAVFENGLPKGWSKAPLSTICDFKRGKNITSDEMCEGAIPVISAGVDVSGYHNSSNVKGVSVTMSSSGANAGFIRIHYSDIWAADCSYIEESTTPNIFYVYELLNNIRTIITNFQRGAAQPHVYPKDINRIKLIIPEINIIEDANKKLETIHHEINKLQQQSVILSRQRDLLLPRLMSGKLEV